MIQFIQLLHSYRGRLTKEQPINPGVYMVNDPKLFGLAKYLVANGHAIYVEAPVRPVIVESPLPETQTELAPAPPPAVTRRRGRPRQTPEE